MNFDYVAYDAKGHATRGTVEAATTQEVAESLRNDGLLVERITKHVEAALPLNVLRARGQRTGRSPHVTSRLKSLVTFSRQLSVLVGTGTPLADALASLERQFPDQAWRPVLADVCRRVEEGVPLSEAMAQHPRHFDTVSRSLVAAGESGGQMAVMLDRLSALTRRQLHVRSSIIGALIYPVLLIVVAVLVLGLMLGFVVPRFSGLFETLDMPLPATTRMLMGLSNALRTYWWVALIGLPLGAVALASWLRSPAGKQFVHTAAVRMPRMGGIVRGLVTARVARLLGVLLTSRVPLLESLTLTRQSCGNMHYESLLTRVEEAVTKGSAMSAALAESDLIEPSVCEAIRNGEQGGRVGEVLTQLADFMDEENEVIVRSLTSIVEPLILIALGVLVGFVAVSTFLPLFDLTSMTQGAH